MTFDEEAMDLAYKCLEGTEKFCDQHNRKFTLFSNSSNASNAEKLTEHEKLYRRTIIADCLLFEAILVFLKQGLTSYVKGGYLLRKAWKMYEKIFQDTEKLCSMPSPITKMGLSSPMDRHIGRSMYDQFQEGEEGEEVLEEEVGEEGCIPPDDNGVAEVSDGLAAMHVGMSMLGGPVKLEFGGNGEDDDGEGGDVMGEAGMITVSNEEHPLSLGGAKLGAPMRSVSAAVLSSSKVQPGFNVQQKSHSQSNLHSKVSYICTGIHTCTCVCVCKVFLCDYVRPLETGTKVHRLHFVHVCHKL